ncbi:MAG: hypothetical protein CL613_04725 [Aquimarina sp.]|nr:hypothetical protein [Aquimarina sp.]
MDNQEEIDQFVQNCFIGKVDEVLESLDKGINPNVKSSYGQTPIIAAINGENLEIVGCLITWMVDLNTGDWTPLHELFDTAIDRMIQNNETEVSSTLLKILEELLKSGADLNKKNKDGKTPLDSIRVYARTEKSFNHLKDCFRSVISDIDERIKMN